MSSKSVVTSTKLADRISNLPDNVIDIILSFLSMRDAIRTSVLSTKWRFHWTRIESLEFDQLFLFRFPQSGQDCEELEEYKYARVVGFILLSHDGPIRNLLLELPNFTSTMFPGAVNAWIHFAGRCGLQDLRVEYELNTGSFWCISSIFQCTELKYLSLDLDGVNLGFPACHSINFPFLCSLELRNCHISGDVLTNIFLSCPLLEVFELDSEHVDLADGPFVIEAPKLNDLTVTYYGLTAFILKYHSNISSLSLTDNASEFLGDVNTYQSIVNFFGAVPNVEDITVNGFVLAISSSFFLLLNLVILCIVGFIYLFERTFLLKQWKEQDIPERLPAPFKNLEIFVVYSLDIYCPRQIHSMLCIIKSSPNLETLCISVGSDSDQYETHDTRSYLRSQLSKMQNLRRLKSVRITGLKGKKWEMIFIQLILSCSPKLKTLYLRTWHRSSKVKLKMMAAIMGFRRASSQAELIYLD